MDRIRPVPPPGASRTIAVGVIRRDGARTITVRATAAGVTGTITPTAVTR